MISKPTDHSFPAIRGIQSLITLGSLHRITHKPNLRNFFSPASHGRTSRREFKKNKEIEARRQSAEEKSNLHDLIERWIRGDDPIFDFPSEAWKALHPQMNYHLQRIRHREQHQLWGAGRLPACKDKDRATILFLNGGGDPEEMRYWPPGLEEEFLHSLVCQWLSDTGI